MPLLAANLSFKKSYAPEEQSCLWNPQFCKQNGPCLKAPFRLDRVTFSTPDLSAPRYDWMKKSLDGTRWRQDFFTSGHCGALVPSLAANGLIVMGPSGVNSLYPSAEESWEEMTKIEPRNKILYSPGSDQWPGRPVILVAEFNQFDSVKNAGIYWPSEGGEKNTWCMEDC